MSAESDRKFNALMIRDDQILAAQLRLNQLRRERKIGSLDFRMARLRLQSIQDRIAVQIEMIDNDMPLIGVPTDDELEALRQQVAAVEQQIAATETAEGLIDLINTLGGEPVENA